MKLLRDKNVFRVLFGNETNDIFGSEYGDTYVTTTTDKESVFFNSQNSNIKILAKGSWNQIYHIHLNWQRVEKKQR